MSDRPREEDDVYYISHVYENCIMAFYDYDEALKEAWRQDPCLVTKVISYKAYESLKRENEILRKALAFYTPKLGCPTEIEHGKVALEALAEYRGEK